jgi:hypothetical protein
MFNSMSGLYFMSSYEVIVKRSLDSKKKVLIDFKLIFNDKGAPQTHN